MKDLKNFLSFLNLIKKHAGKKGLNYLKRTPNHFRAQNEAPFSYEFVFFEFDHYALSHDGKRLWLIAPYASIFSEKTLIRKQNIKELGPGLANEIEGIVESLEEDPLSCGFYRASLVYKYPPNVWTKYIDIPLEFLIKTGEVKVSDVTKF